MADLNGHKKVLEYSQEITNCPCLLLIKVTKLVYDGNIYL